MLGSDIGSATAPVGEVTARGASIAAQQLFASGSIALDADDVRVRRIDTPAGLQLGNRLTVAGRVDISAGSADIAAVRGTPDANDALTITAQQGFEVPGADASLESLMVVSTAGSLTLNSPVALGGNTFIGVSEGDFTVNANIDNAAGNVEIFTGGAFVQDPASIITSPAGFVRIAANSGMLIGTIDARNIYLTLTGTGSSFQRAKVGIDLSNDLIAADSVIFTSSVPVDVGTQTNTFGIRATSSAFLVGGQVFEPRSNALERSSLTATELALLSDTSTAGALAATSLNLRAVVASIPNAAQLGAGTRVASTGQLALASAQASQTRTDEEIAQITDDAFQDRDPYIYNEENSIGLPPDQDEFADRRGVDGNPVARLFNWLWRAFDQAPQTQAAVAPLADRGEAGAAGGGE